jgi:hypothetical protein
VKTNRNLFGHRFFGSVDKFIYADDKFCPTWQSRRGNRLAAKHRRQLCVHLSAHAAISRMGGAYIYKLAVAPTHVRSWTIVERKNGDLGTLRGLCSTSDFYCSHMMWHEGHQEFEVDRDGWEAYLTSRSIGLLRACPPDEREGYERILDVETHISDQRQIVRAQACGYLAGHIADGITAGMTADDALRLYDRRDQQYVGATGDIVIAQGLTDLLPPGEYENAVRVTEEALRRPDVWESVNRLAGELEQLGLIESDKCEVDIDELLPEPTGDWPPAPGHVDANP